MVTTKVLRINQSYTATFMPVMPMWYSSCSEKKNITLLGCVNRGVTDSGKIAARIWTEILKLCYKVKQLLWILEPFWENLNWGYNKELESSSSKWNKYSKQSSRTCSDKVKMPVWMCEMFPFQPPFSCFTLERRAEFQPSEFPSELYRRLCIIPGCFLVRNC